MPPKKTIPVPARGSRFHDMLVVWLNADSGLKYDGTTKLSALWMEWKYGAPYDNYAIHKLLEAVDTFYGSCLQQEDVEITFDEFLQSGDLQLARDLADRLVDCQ
jgi:hypothetical protein